MAEAKTKPDEASVNSANLPVPDEAKVEAPPQVGTTWSPTTAEMSTTLLTIKMLIYGQSGIGKTRLAASAADVKELCPVLFVDAEAGTMSIRERKDLQVFRMSDYAALQKFVGFMRNGVEKEYKTVVVDSLTDIGRTVIRQCVLDARRANSNHDPEIPGMQDWGRYTERMKIIIRSLRDSPVNVVLTSLARDDKDELSGKISYKPALQGAAAAMDAVAYMDIIGYYAPVGGGKSTPTLFFNTNAGFVAKDRSGLLPEKMEEPTFTQIHKLITGGNK